jgi:type IV pilus assembly protein PilB
MEKGALKLGEILVKKGWVTSVAVDIALATQKRTREFLGEILLKDKKVSEEHLAMALSEQSGLPFVRLDQYSIDWPLTLRFSVALVMEKKCFPLEVKGDEITFAITNVLDAWLLSQIESECRTYRVRLVLVTPKDMNELMTRYREYVNIKIRKRLESGNF